MLFAAVEIHRPRERSAPGAFAPLALGSTMSGDTSAQRQDDHANSDQVNIDMGRATKIDIRTSYDAPLVAAPSGALDAVKSPSPRRSPMPLV